MIHVTCDQSEVKAVSLRTPRNEMGDLLSASLERRASTLSTAVLCVARALRLLNCGYVVELKTEYIALSEGTQPLPLCLLHLNFFPSPRGSAPFANEIRLVSELSCGTQILLYYT